MPELIQPTILLVDDSQQNRYVLRRLLERANFKVAIAASGTEALQLVENAPDLIILDVKLPDMSGYDVCRRIKSNPATSAIPVLQISASFVSNESKAMALEGGADGYLTHPIESPVLIATVRSLLRMRRAEISARNAAQQWQSTFDSLAESVAFLDDRDGVLRFNKSFADLCDITSESNLKQCLESVIGDSRMSKIGERNARLSEDIRYRNRWLRLTTNPVSSGNQYIGTVIVMHDFTERVRAEEVLRDNQQMAATGRLAHTIAHEINNPLEALTNLVYLSQAAAARDDVKQFLKMASAELERMGRITKQVLSFNRDSNRSIPCDVGELINSALDLLAIQIAEKSIEIHYDPARQLFVEGYPGELRQVFVNLLSNAIEATGTGGSITIRIKPASTSCRNCVQVTIHDNGSGIPRSINKQVFEPFFTTKELKGSGLGLWLSKNILAKHEGSLRFKTRTGELHGTSFRLVLPALKQLDDQL